MSKKFLRMIPAVIVLLSTFPALAAQGGWAAAEQMRARLISEFDGLGAQAEFDAGLDIEMGQGWHTYWKMPGDTGLPPRFDWSASENVKGIEVLFPVPVRKSEMGLQVFGYEGRVFLPLRVNVKEAGKPVHLSVKAGVMVCKEICIPQDVVLDLLLPAGQAEVPAKAERARIALEKRNLPQAQDTAQLKILTAVVGKDALALGVYAKDGFDSADLVAYSDDLYLTALPKVEVDPADKTRATISVPRPEGTDDLHAALAGKTVRILLTSGRNALEKEIRF